MLNIIMAAILWLQPTVPSKTVKLYATTIKEASEFYRVDPLLVVAIIHRETGGSWDRRTQSKTRDYGLMQIRVVGDSNALFQGKEYLLFDPSINIWRGTYLLYKFREWHREHCKPGHHAYWAHHMWGFRKPLSREPEERVKKVYNALLEREFIKRMEEPISRLEPLTTRRMAWALY